jgi:hypothetical protein
MHQEWFGEHVAQESETRHDGAECRGLRDDVGKFDLQQIAGRRTLHEYGASQRMDGAGFDRRKIGAGHFWPDLTVQSITGLQGDFFAFLDLCDRRDIGMIAVVPDMRFLCERFAAIDTDGLHVYLPYF